MRQHLLRHLVASPRSIAFALSFGAVSTIIGCGDDTFDTGGAGGQGVTVATHAASSVSSSTTTSSSNSSTHASASASTGASTGSTAASTGSTSASTAASSSSGGPTGEQDCANGTDDDGDGMTDCADSDCAASIECGTVVVNEVDYDQPNADENEFVEIFNKGATPVDLEGVSIELIDGGASTSYRSVDLSGNTLAAGQYLVVGSSTVVAAAGALKVDFTGASNQIQNGPDAVALYDSHAHKVIDALSYEGSVTAATIDGNTFNLVAGTATTAVDGNLAPNNSLIRFPNGADTANDAVDWVATDTVTPGASNTFAAAEICDDNVDNNGNGMIDCAEASCDTQDCNAFGKTCVGGACSCVGGTATELACGDGTDDDCDGLVDCADPDCAASLLCAENCSDGIDNDGDGLIDCMAPTCLGQSCGANGLTCVLTACACPGGATTETSCTDGTDNDCDGTVDCADSDCAGNPACAAGGALVISQVYGGGGNSGAPLTYDYVELFNRGTGPVSINGYSLQYASASGATWSVYLLPNASIPAGGHFLVQLASQNVTVGSPLPVTADSVGIATGTGSINMSGSNGKVALVNSVLPLTCGATAGSCAAVPTLVDLVGYGTAAEFEGSSAAPALSATLAALRNNGGCQDTNQNGANFATGTWIVGPPPSGVTLHNASSAVTVCP